MTLSPFSALPVEPVRRRGQGGVVTPILPLAGARLRFFLLLTVASLRHFLSHRVWGSLLWNVVMRSRSKPVTVWLSAMAVRPLLPPA